MLADRGSGRLQLPLLPREAPALPQVFNFDKDHQDDIIVVTSSSGQRRSLTRDDLLDLLELRERIDRFAPRPEQVVQVRPLVPLGPSPLTLFSLGKKVDGLIKRRLGGSKANVSLWNHTLQIWLGAFDGQLPRRFSSRIADHLMQIKAWPDCEPSTKATIEDFLARFPQLLAPPQNKMTGAPKRAARKKR